MKNKKGFTLIELIAVLVVLSILITSSVAVFINIRNSVLRKEKNNLITYLETKAIEYANETNVTAISVEDLIKIGLIKPDDETDIYDPVTRESMNCYIIDLVWEDGEYKAKFGSNVGKNGTTCNEYTRRKNLVICQVVGNNCNDIKNEQWFKDDITIGLKFVNGKRIIKESGYEISWKSNTGISSIEDTIKTNVDLIANINYTAKVIKDNEVSEASQIVNIDKEAPLINEIKYNINWSKSKEIEIIASDGLGSGVEGYVIVLENEKCSGYNTNNKITIKSNGNYKVCIRDKAGNETEKVIKVSTIDTKPENPVISASDGITSGKFHSKDYTLSWKSVYEGTQDLIYYYGTDKTKMINKGTSVGVKKDQYNVIMYVKACTRESNLCSGISSYKINVDTIPTNPVISASDGQVSGSYHDKDYTLSWKSTNQGSQNLIYYYGTNPSKLSSTGISMTAKKTQYGIYVYVKACTVNNTCSGISKYMINLDDEAPVITLTSTDLTYKTIRENYTLSAKITDSKSGIVAYAVTGYETPKKWIDVNTTKTLNVSRDITWNEYAYYYVFAKDAVGNIGKGGPYRVQIDRDIPASAEHDVSYDCSTGRYFLSANTNFIALSIGTWYAATTNKTAPSASSSSWVPGCSGLKKGDPIPARCVGMRTNLNRTGDTYFWVKACNKYNECSVSAIGHAVCKNYSNSEKINYNTELSECYGGYKFYDITTDKYKCLYNDLALYNIADKNLEVPCPKNAWGTKVIVEGTNYCCDSGWTLNTKYKIGSYYSCQRVFDPPICSSSKKLSSNFGYCIQK